MCGGPGWRISQKGVGGGRKLLWLVLVGELFMSSHNLSFGPCIQTAVSNKQNAQGHISLSAVSVHYPNPIIHLWPLHGGKLAQWFDKLSKSPAAKRPRSRPIFRKRTSYRSVRETGTKTRIVCSDNSG